MALLNAIAKNWSFGSFSKRFCITESQAYLSSKILSSQLWEQTLRWDHSAADTMYGTICILLLSQDLMHKQSRSSSCLILSMWIWSDSVFYTMQDLQYDHTTLYWPVYFCLNIIDQQITSTLHITLIQDLIVGSEHHVGDQILSVFLYCISEADDSSPCFLTAHYHTFSFFRS